MMASAPAFPALSTAPAPLTIAVGQISLQGCSVRRASILPQYKPDAGETKVRLRMMSERNPTTCQAQSTPRGRPEEDSEEEVMSHIRRIRQYFLLSFMKSHRKSEANIEFLAGEAVKRSSFAYRRACLTRQKSSTRMPRLLL